MPSVLEHWGIKKQPPFTSIPELGVNNYINTLQITSQDYFTIERAAQASDGDVLGVSVVGDSFDITNEKHIAFLNQSTALVKDKLMQLKSIDAKITASVVVGVVATSLSFLPLVSILGWIGWGSALYYMNQRAIAYAEYQESLTLLVASCNWSLGPDAEHRKNSDAELTSNQSIRNMMTQLYPVLTETQVRHLIADDIEDSFAEELVEYERKFELGFSPERFFSKNDEEIALSKKGAEFNRCIYGFNKGNFTDFLDAIVSALPDLYHATQHGFQRLKYWWQERSHKPEEEKTPSLTTSKN